MDDKKKEILKKPKIDWNWTNCLSGFLVYPVVIVCEHPDRGPALFQDLDIIYKAYLNFASDCWLQHDEDFRIRANSNPSLAWDQVLSGFWLQIMTGNKVLLGERAHSGYMVQHTAGSVALPHPCACWEYNSQGAVPHPNWHIGNIIPKGLVTGRFAVTDMSALPVLGPIWLPIVPITRSAISSIGKGVPALVPGLTLTKGPAP